MKTGLLTKREVMIMRSIYSVLFLLCGVTVGLSQAEEKCTVNLLENRVAAKLKQEIDNGNPPADSKKGLLQLGEFTTDIGEERLTSKSFKIPSTKHFVIASVYYTDESMGWKDVPTDSVYMGIAVSRKIRASAMGVPSRSLAEVNFTQLTKTMRVSTQAVVRGRRVTAILECKWNFDDDEK